MCLRCREHAGARDYLRCRDYSKPYDVVIIDSYTFVHRLLMGHFASLYTEESEEAWKM